MAYLGWLFTGLLFGGGIVFLAMTRFGFARLHGDGGKTSVASLLRSHFRPLPIDDIKISERQFPLPRLFGGQAA